MYSKKIIIAGNIDNLSELIATASIQVHFCFKFHSRFLKEEEEEEMDVYTSWTIYKNSKEIIIAENIDNLSELIASAT